MVINTYASKKYTPVKTNKREFIKKRRPRFAYKRKNGLLIYLARILFYDPSS